MVRDQKSLETTPVDDLGAVDEHAALSWKPKFLAF